MDKEKAKALTEVLKVAVRIAAYPPLKKSEFASDAKIPWREIKELRETLAAAGIDWEKVFRASRKN